MRRLTILALLAGDVAWAADVDRFEPATSNAYGQGTLQGESPRLTTEGFGGGLFASYAQDPVVRVFDDGREVAEVASMLPLALYGGYTWRDDVRFELVLPVYAHVDAPGQGFRGAAMGDARLQANVPVYAGESVAFSLVPRIGLPTGSDTALTGQGFQGGLLAALGGEVTDVDVGWVLNAGVTGSGTDAYADVALGSTFDALVGGWWRASDAFRLGAELDVRAGLVDGGSTTSSTHVFAQNVLPSGLGMTVGAGTGVIGGIGTPEYRAFAALTWGSATRDRDGDGLADAADGCADQAEDVDTFQDTDGCPDPDNDGDGLGDYSDACDDGAEDLDQFQDTDGCPDLDNDADQVADADDACPDVPGTRAARGCPDADGDGLIGEADACPTERGPQPTAGCPDGDGDGVADRVDVCDDQPRPTDEDLELSDGCPKAAWLAGDRIQLAERVEFVTTGAVLRPQSKVLLDAVAALLAQVPELKKVEVQVHLDDSVEEQASLKLTQQRADAVRTYLTSHGVDAGRVVAKGLGKTQPIDTNRTEAGRYNNRRVEVHVLQQDGIARRPAPAPAPATPEGSPWGSAETITRPAEASPWGEVPADLDPAGKPGLLTVKVQGGGWGTVYLDGQRLTKGAPFTDFSVPAGVHELRVSNPDSKIDHRETLRIHNGESVSILVASPKGAADEASPWTEAEEPKKPTAFDGSFPIFPEAEEVEEAPAPVEDLDGKRPPRSSKKK